MSIFLMVFIRSFLRMEEALIGNIYLYIRVFGQKIELNMNEGQCALP